MMLRKQESKETSFLRSALMADGLLIPTDEFLDWFKSRNQACVSEVCKIPLSDLEDWYFSDCPRRLVHQSGKFFTVGGIKVKTTFGSVPEWDQPIIIQPEVGILGVITKVVGDVRYFLLQAKMEPGNVNSVQLSPTVQATRSNYTCVHKGKLPLYLEYFINRGKAKILVDQIQSEQGARFFQKVNRNIVVEVETDILIHKNFCWLTLGQIKQLLLKDNIVNMDLRSVLSCIPFMSADLHRSLGVNFSPESARIQIFDQQITGFSKSLLESMTCKESVCHTLDEIIGWYTEMRSKYYLAVEHISLDKVRGWIQTDCDIRQETGQYFSVVGVKVKARDREVGIWSQPLLAASGHGLVGFLTQKINGVLHFLTCAKMQPGTIGAIEVGPTVTCSHVKERANEASAPPFLDLFLNASAENLRYSSIQSEEGGRFYHEQNRYMVIEISPDSQIDLKENYIWMTLRQVMDLTKHRYFNVEARNLISCLNFSQWI
jgi:oxidase EvaA|tara:strand:+ start:755 stop:2218 length:1464 start_codon:yes stop_codon:yes gene_type:complete